MTMDAARWIASSSILERPAHAGKGVFGSTIEYTGPIDGQSEVRPMFDPGMGPGSRAPTQE